jgi:hypothetical protein
MGDKKPARFKAVANWYYGNFLGNAPLFSGQAKHYTTSG